MARQDYLTRTLCLSKNYLQTFVMNIFQIKPLVRDIYTRITYSKDFRATVFSS